MRRLDIGALWFVVFVLLSAFIASTLFLADVCVSRNDEITSLKQQLEQARSLAGRPINISALPDGSWCRVSTDECAILQRDGDNIIRAVVSDRKIPGQFAIKDMRTQVFDFLKENPPAEKPEMGIQHTFTPK